MEMNAANVAQHKLFPVKPTSTKKINEKGRFGDLATEEIRQEIMDKAVPETIKKPQSSE